MGIKMDIVVGVMISVISIVVTVVIIRYNNTPPASNQSANYIREFKIYWNIPSKRCHEKFNIDLELEKYPIITNSDRDGWAGDEISIFYGDLGLYPHINDKTGKTFNGGIPQLANWDAHWKKVKRDIIKRIPNKNFSGLGVLDYEPWRPVYLRNFGKKRVYQKASMDLVTEKYPCLNETKTIKKLAEFEFDESAKQFMLGTLQLAQKLRPNAKWGYYHFIYCYRHVGENNCIDKHLNDRLDWLMDASDVFYPTAYLHKKMNTTSKWLFVNGQIRETKRVRNNLISDTPFSAPKSAYMYCRIRYNEDYSWFSEMDLKQSIGQVYRSGLEGVVLWDNHHIADTLEVCQTLKKYINNTLGPYVNTILT